MSVTEDSSNQAGEPGDDLELSDISPGGAVVPFKRRGHQTAPADDTSPPPARRDATSLTRVDASELEPGSPALDADIVEDDPPAKPTSSVVRVLQPVIIVVRHDKTVAASKVLARNLVFVFSGVGVLAKRWYDQRHKYERYERQAELAGDQENKKYWSEQGEKARENRHKRRMDRAKLAWERAKRTVLYVPLVAALLVLLGVALSAATDDWTLWYGPLVGTVKAVGWIVATFVALVWLVVALVVTTGVGVVWWAGRRAEAAPAWTLAPKSMNATANSVITADQIVRALQKLGIAELNRAFKEGWIPPFDLPPTREGSGEFKGYRTIFGLPEGVTPAMIVDKADVLAGNISRTGMETWPSDYGQEKGGKARHVNLYVADRGVMDKPTPTYPLMHEGSADVFAGVPIGITQRGDGTLMPMVGSNFVFGGRPGQGKSNGVRVVAAGASLDPLCEIRVHVFAGNGDFDEYEPRLSRYMKGASPEHAAAATMHLEELLAEVERREYRLADLGAKKLTRPIAAQHPDMRPLLVIFSECHELFTDKESGERAAELAVPVLKRGRKTGVMTGWDTQSSRANAIPSALVENMGVNCCFSVKTWRSNDGFLGDGSFAAGIRATELRFNVDRGSMITTGMTDELFELIRTYFIEVDDDAGWDAATQIIERAMAQINPQTRVHTDRPLLQPAMTRDLLDDLVSLLGDQPVPAGEAVGALKTLAPNWYSKWTVPKLVDALADEGVRVVKTGNRFPVKPAEVREARDMRQRS